MKQSGKYANLRTCRDSATHAKVKKEMKRGVSRLTRTRLNRAVAKQVRDDR